MKKEAVRGVVVLVFLFALLGLLSCAAPGPAKIQIKDDLAPGVPKGYVKVYYLRSEGEPVGDVDFYLTDNPDTNKIYYNKKMWKQEGKVIKKYQENQDEVWLRVAKKPGVYQFLIEGEGVLSEIIKAQLLTAGAVGEVKIQDGMVTPIKLHFFSKYRVTGQGLNFLIAMMRMKVEQPIPFVPEKPKK